MGLTVKADTTGNLRKASGNIGKVKGSVSFLIATTLVRYVQRGIIYQEFPLAPKSWDWARRSRDPRPLINEKDYVKGLKAVRQGETGAAIKGDLRLAKRLEFGTKTMPARPHWRPAINKLNESLNGLITKEMMGGLFGD